MPLIRAEQPPATWAFVADDKPQLHPFTYTYLNKISVYLFTVMHIITFLILTYTII